MARYIFVAGGVMSGIGKGVATAAEGFRGKRNDYGWC